MATGVVAIMLHELRGSTMEILTSMSSLSEPYRDITDQTRLRRRTRPVQQGVNQQERRRTMQHPSWWCVRSLSTATFKSAEHYQAG